MYYTFLIFITCIINWILIGWLLLLLFIIHIIIFVSHNKPTFENFHLQVDVIINFKI
jgi:hypothetical protein